MREYKHISVIVAIILIVAVFSSCMKREQSDEILESKVSGNGTEEETDKQIPIIYGVDVVHGLALVKDAVVFPHNIGLGAANDMGLQCDLSITGEFDQKKNKEAIDYAESIGKPVVTLLAAGRNVIIGEYVDSWDGIVMCYLPGSEGDRVASVLSGEAGFTGKLPMPYYKSVEDIVNEEAVRHNLI